MAHSRERVVRNTPESSVQRATGWRAAARSPKWCSLHRKKRWSVWDFFCWEDATSGRAFGGPGGGAGGADRCRVQASAHPKDGVDCERTFEVRQSSTGIPEARSSERSVASIAAVTAWPCKEEMEEQRTGGSEHIKLSPRMHISSLL